MPTFFEFVADQRRDLPILATSETCSGRTYIVTGANIGLGFETAKHLARLGAEKVILAVRNFQAGEMAKGEIESATRTRNVIDVWSLDLAQYKSVKSFAKRAIDELDRIDGLIENAGVALLEWQTAEDYESTITINVFGTLLLAVLLLPRMTECARRFNILPHIVIVTSEVSFMAKPEFDKIKDDPFVKMNDPNQSDIRQRYPLSKLIQVLAVRRLATLVSESQTGVVINLLNPGLCKTQLSRNAGFLLRLQIRLANMLFGRTVEMGSRTLLHAAIAGRESHGCYLAACEIRENQVPDWVTNGEGKRLQKLIWDGVAQRLESIEPGCTKRIL